nr:MAG TPA: resistance protein [Bacteriophage sp.]
MSSLYSLTSDYLQVLDMAESGEVDADVIIDTLEGISGEIEVKAENYAKVMKSIEATAEALSKEEQRLALRRKVLENNVSRMKKSLEQSMIATDNKKFKTTLFSFSIQKNPASLVVSGEVPEEYLVPQPPKVDNARIKEELKTKDLPFAHLEQGESLRIR